MLDRGQVPGTPPQPWHHNKIIKRKGDNRMPEIKMKIGERKQEAEIKLLEALENHGWRKLDVLEAIDAELELVVVITSGRYISSISKLFSFFAFVKFF